jgi:hypothetical protein
MMEAARTFETLVNFYQITWCYNPEDSHPGKGKVIPAMQMYGGMEEGSGGIASRILTLGIR